MKAWRSTLLGLVLVAGLSLVASCVGDFSAVASLLSLVSLLAFARFADAGPPVPCTGVETPICSGGFVYNQCCQKGQKCPPVQPYVDCGSRYCALGHDRGKCVAPQPMRDPAWKNQQECRAHSGNWEPACVDHQVADACIMSYPTNYGGPSHNPAFRQCMNNTRCTTSTLFEDCFLPHDATTPTCANGWSKVCLGGKIEERCLPAGANTTEFPSLQYVPCVTTNTQCAIGSDPKACN